MILSPVDDGTGTYAVKPTIGRQTQYVVEQVLESTGSIPIPEGKAVLTLNAKDKAELLAPCAPFSRRHGDAFRVQQRSAAGPA